jgi:type II secretory pathway pseudopilin PulG
MKYWGRDAVRARMRGYTIVEVMIVLSVTGVMFISAVLIFQHQQGRTSLSQSLYDMASRIQSYASEVNAGVYPTDPQTYYSCKAQAGFGGTQAWLTGAGSPSLGSSTDCLFLGRSLQLAYNSASPTTSNKLVAYTALGLRDIWSGGVDSGTAAASYDQANPVPAQCKSGCSAPNQWALYTTYTLPYGEYFTKSALTDQDGNSPFATGTFFGMVGIFQDISTSNATLNLRGYNFKDTASAGTNEQKCIEQQAPCNLYLDQGHSWEICVQNGNNIGSIMVSANSTGVTTNVNAGACP